MARPPPLVVSLPAAPLGRGCDQGLSRIYLRGIYPAIISKIIRNMGLDDIF